MSREKYFLREIPDLFIVDDCGNIVDCIDTLIDYKQSTNGNSTYINFTDQTFSDEKFQIFGEEIKNYSLYVRANRRFVKTGKDEYDFCQKFTGLCVFDSSFTLTVEPKENSCYTCEIFAKKREIISPKDCPKKIGVDYRGTSICCFEE